MKSVVIFLVVLAMLVPVIGATAEAAVAAPGGVWGIDWTQVIVWLIGVVATAFSALLARVWTVHVKPWLEQKGLMDAAGIVVNAVEALLGRYCGEEKWLAALEKMRERGFDADSQAVIDALKAAWQQMNVEQIAAGVKEPDAMESEYGPIQTETIAEYHENGEPMKVTTVTTYGEPISND